MTATKTAESSFAIDTSLVRGIAVLAVMNSHFESFYPVHGLADGGMIGLIFFFVASGFGIGLSSTTRKMRWLPWYVHRLKRIYPSLLVTVTLFSGLIRGGWRGLSLREIAGELIYPTRYRFIAMIVVHYALLYFYVRWRERRKHAWMILASVVTLLLLAIPDMIRLAANPVPLRTGQLSQPFLWMFFLAITLLGVTIADHRERFFSRLRYWDLWGMLVWSGLYITTKLAICRFGIFPQAFLIYFAAAIGWSLHAIRIAANPQTTAAWRGSAPLAGFVSLLSMISLEFYLVHTEVATWEVWPWIPFPANIGLFFVVSFALSWLVWKLCQGIQRAIG